MKAKEIISSKDWERMFDLVVTSTFNSKVANSIKDKDKAIARFVAGLKLNGNDLDYMERWKQFNGDFFEFGNRAIELGATKEEIQSIFDKTTVPVAFSEKLARYTAKDKKLGNRFVGSLSKKILDSGWDITFLPGNENALTADGREAMDRNGRKWTIGYRAQIEKDGRVLNLNFDAITDEGDGPTYYNIDHSSSSPEFIDVPWGQLGKTSFEKEVMGRIK